MALNEACQVWIEQRIEEELQDRSETGKSFREIGRELAAEIEKIFEAKVNPGTLLTKVTRAAVSNETPKEQQTNQEINVEPVAPQPIKMTTEQIVTAIDEMVKSGMSIREASRVLAEKVGRAPHGLRRSYAKVKEAEHTNCKAQFAWQYAKVAIYQLERIPKDDPDKIKALTEVRDWINKQEGM